MKVIHVGLIGWGTGGSGVVKILRENGPLIEKRLGSKIVLNEIEGAFEGLPVRRSAARPTAGGER